MADEIDNKDIQDLKKQVAEMRIGFIGIDGHSGLKGDVNELKKDVKSLTRTVDDIAVNLSNIKDEQNRNHELFAYKSEVNRTEDRIMLKLNDMDRKREEARKGDEDRKSSSSRGRVALVISTIGLLASVLFSSLNFFLK